MAAANSLVIRVIKEGQAQLQIPKTVFYNPVQEFNRDLSVLVLRTYLKHNVWHHKREEQHVTARGGIKILDALSASGLRSIRYAKELGEAGQKVSKIVANDLSQNAVELIMKNIQINNVQNIVACTHSDAAQLMHSSFNTYEDRFHVIDLDPFGTGAQFFDAAVKSIGEAGLLMVTCTDVAVLCGNASESCFARYGSMSIRADFCHDAALRIILRSLEQHANVYGRYIKPLLSMSIDFYVRLYVQVFTQQAETKRSASKLSQVYLCKECKTHELQPLGTHEIKEVSKQAKSKNLAVSHKFKAADMMVGDRCKICQGRFTLAGPIWNGPIHDNSFLELLKQELEDKETQEQFATFRRIQGMLYVCSEELPVPLFYSYRKISSVLKMKLPRSRDIMSALVNAGYEVSQTHTNQYGLKTNAPNTVVWEIFGQIAGAIKSSKISLDTKLTHGEGNNSERKELNSGGGEEKVSSDQSARQKEKSYHNSLIDRIMGKMSERTYDFTYNPKIENESQKLSLLRFQVNPTRDWGPMSRPEAVPAEVKGDREAMKTDTNEEEPARKRRQVDADLGDV